MSTLIYPPIPERLLCVPFNRPYTGLVLSGRKPKETRSRAWKGAPAWIALYATLKVVPLQADVEDRDRLMQLYAEPETAQHVVGIVWIAGSQPLVREDFAESLYWGPGLHAWKCERPRRLKRLLSLAEAGLKVPPQSPVYMAGRLLEQAGFRA